MNWQSIISDLMKAGLTQVEIGEAAELAQSSISDLYRGVTKDVSWQTGSRLNDLYRRRVPTKDGDVQLSEGS